MKAVRKFNLSILGAEVKENSAQINNRDHSFFHKYDSFLCPHHLHQFRAALNLQLDQYPLTTELEKRLIPHIVQLVLSPDGHRICLGNWNSAQLTSLASALLPTDSSEVIEAVLLDFSHTLFPRIDAIWKARMQAKYIEAEEHSTGAHPITLRALQRKYKPFSPGRSRNRKYSTVSGWVTSLASIRPGKRPSRTP